VKNRVCFNLQSHTIEKLKECLCFYEIWDNGDYLPARRRAQLQSLFHKAEELQHLFGRTGFQRMEDEWLPEIEGLLRRLDEIPREKVREALKELGDPNSDNYWQKIDGAYYHQLPDLLLAWDFAYDLTIEPGLEITFIQPFPLPWIF
jgi:predicted MPP superfamily phosphohydrolase